MEDHVENDFSGDLAVDIINESDDYESFEAATNIANNLIDSVDPQHKVRLESTNT